jgi:predicted RNase H-like nuclease (RuvC/YqgF family)
MRKVTKDIYKNETKEMEKELKKFGQENAELRNKVEELSSEREVYKKKIEELIKKSSELEKLKKFIEDKLNEIEGGVDFGERRIRLDSNDGSKKKQLNESQIEAIRWEQQNYASCKEVIECVIELVGGKAKLALNSKNNFNKEDN